jgi:hypothetical protein
MRARSRSVRRQAGSRSRLIRTQFDNRSWRIASLRCVAEFGRYRGRSAHCLSAHQSSSITSAHSPICDGLDGELRCTSKLPLSRNVAYDAIASTLPKGAARRPLQRDWGQCFIQVEAAVVDRMRAMRRPGESYRDVISGSSNSRRGGGGPEVTAKHDARSDRRGAADGPRVEAPRCAREEPL